MEQVSFAHDESTTTTPEKNMNSQQEIQEKVEKERELEEFEKHPDLVGLACKVIVGTMTQTLSQRMTRLTDQIEIDQKHLQAYVFAPPPLFLFFQTGNLGRSLQMDV